MMSYLDFLFLSYSGRIGRVTFWLALLVLTVIEFGAIALLMLGARDVFEAAANHQSLPSQEVLVRVFVPMFIVTLLFLYPTYAIYTKRWHDRDKSGWWSLIGFLPIIGSLWMTIELGFLGGTEGGNQYGIR
ncbi:MAG TPA: DUF805 domain-containing protein [Devosiaceae bacterium]|jgi:uncharacterized membrane protein YhaH (DUF805 family)|nr:DUF805 domain-containing protein [Devosiaceae bacterium]